MEVPATKPCLDMSLCPVYTVPGKPQLSTSITQAPMEAPKIRAPEWLSTLSIDPVCTGNTGRDPGRVTLLRHHHCITQTVCLMQVDPSKLTLTAGTLLKTCSLWDSGVGGPESKKHKR